MGNRASCARRRVTVGHGRSASLAVLVVVGRSVAARCLLPLVSLSHLWPRRSPRSSTYTYHDRLKSSRCLLQGPRVHSPCCASRGLALARRAAPVAAAVQGRWVGCRSCTFYNVRCCASSRLTLYSSRKHQHPPFGRHRAPPLRAHDTCRPRPADSCSLRTSLRRGTYRSSPAIPVDLSLPQP